MSAAEISNPAVVVIEPGTKVSDDAYHIAMCSRADAREASTRIVKHLWIIFVLLPVVLAILYSLLK